MASSTKYLSVFAGNFVGAANTSILIVEEEEDNKTASPTAVEDTAAVLDSCSSVERLTSLHQRDAG